MFLYDISPDGKWMALWAGVDIKAYTTGGGAPTPLCANCASSGAEERGVTRARVSWSRDGKNLYLHSDITRETYAIPLKPGQALPPLPPTGIEWRLRPPAIAGSRTIPHQRAFMGPDSAVYAYPEISVHRNIYRIGVP